MKIRIRVTLLLTLIGLISMTVATIGVGSFLTARSSARELATQILDQTSLRIDQEVSRLVGEATSQSALTAKLLASGQLSSHDPGQLVRYWREVLAVNPDLTSCFICLEDSGATVGISRLQNGQLSVWQTTRDPDTAGLQLREFPVADFPGTSSRVAAGPDIRERPWYVAAKRQGHATWTDTYAFLGVEGVRDVQGVTYAEPANASGTLDAVISADFDLGALSRFLEAVHVGATGFALLVEFREDGSRRVIAHAHPDDPRVVAFMAHAPSAWMAGAGELRFDIGGETLLGGYRALRGDHAPHWMIGTVLPEDEILASAHAGIRLTIFITLGALGLAILLGVLVARRVARPLEDLARDVAAAGQLRLDQRPVGRSFLLEVDRLALASEEMKTGLRSFQKYLPADLVRGLLESGQEAKLGGERRLLTIYFSDIADFTAHAEAMDSVALVEHLGEYLGAMNEQILASGGTVDKYIGDAVMAFWNAPAPVEGHAVAACVAALDCQRRLRELQATWRAAGKPVFDTRIGIHTGEAVVGNIGSAARMNYTAIGDSMNLASRLEGLNKHYGTAILISEDTRTQLDDRFAVRPIDWVSVKGRTRAVAMFELLGFADQVDAATRELATRYGAALTAYRARAWDEALRLLALALELRPDDGPSTTLRARCAHYRAHPPDDRWDGVFRATTK